MTISTLSRGTIIVRSILARAATCGRGSEVPYAAERWGETTARVTKAAVDAGGLTSGAWGAVLATPEAIEFFAAVEQASVVGRLGLRPVALNVRTLALTGGASAYWVGGGGPKPISKMALDGETLNPLKVAAIYVLTNEAARFANAAAEAGLRADLVRTDAEAIDAAFLDPANAGVADEMPASVTNGVSPIASTGSPADDIAALIAAFTGDLASASFVTDPETAARIALARDAAGGFLFPDCGPRGGSILGMPLIVSRSSPRDSSGGILALIDGSGIAYGAEGVRTVVSNEATLAMADDPASPADQVSLFQTNSVAVLSEVAVNWKVVRSGSVAYAADADYEVSP